MIGDYKSDAQTLSITINKRDAQLGNLSVNQNGTFQYGDTIQVKFTPEKQNEGNVAAANALAEDTAQLTYTDAEGGTKILAEADKSADGSFTLRYDTAEKNLPLGIIWP